MSTQISAQVLPESLPSISALQELKSGSALLASAKPEEQKAFLDSLKDNELASLPWLFEFWAHEHQLPPEGDWRSWVIMGGRGAGKTRAGSEWVRSMVEGAMPCDPGKATRVALVGETYDQARDVMVFGDSGILACTPPDRRPRWSATRRRLEWPNGATAEVFSATSPEALRGPQFDAAWVDELGCAAIDKGTNQPNKFLDPKSSESALPHYSSGRRDDFIQMQYLEAYADLFSEPEHNPHSDIYDGPMVETDRMYVWAWDARPWPEFPNSLSVWSDGDNHARGHWLTGRSSSVRLSDAVREICAVAGLKDVDVSGLHGVVRGLLLPDIETARASLQQLMLTYGFDAIEEGGKVVFRPRGTGQTAEIDRDFLVLPDGEATVLEQTRAPEAEVTGLVRVTYTDASGKFDDRVAEARFPSDMSSELTQSDLSISLTAQEARGVAERWLLEARIARDSVKLALPPSRRDIKAGDVLSIDTVNNGTTDFRIDRIEDSGTRMIEATRAESQIYEPSDAVEALPSVRPFSVPIPISAQFMDLPLLKGDEVPHAPFISALASPWPGGAAVYSSSIDADYRLNTIVENPAVMGVTLTSVAQGRPGLWQRGQGLQVQLARGALSSASEQAVLAGANAAALGDGSSDNWEIIQFRNAELIGAETYRLSNLLRGQAGSDGLAPAEWPVGTRFVLLDGTQQQIELDLSMRDLARHYRIGPAQRPVDDPSFQYYVEAFAGIGLKPYAPAHLRTGWSGGDININWIRRTRIDGDNWSLFEVPLGEESESYLVRVEDSGSVIREVIVSTPNWTYSASLRATDAIGPSFHISVAQISSRFGPGYFSRIEIDA